MKPISKELLAKLIQPAALEPMSADPHIDHAKIMEESRRSGVPDDELRRVAMDEFYEDQEWERKEEALRSCIDREAAANAQYFGGNQELLRKALLSYFLGSSEIRFSSKLREEKFNQIVIKIESDDGVQ